MAEKAIVRSMRLLELLAQGDSARGISELSRELDWTKSGLHRLLNTFVELGYVRKIEEKQQYQLTHKLLQLASRAVKKLDLRRAALPYLQSLLDETGETARLSILTSGTVICIEQVESLHPVRVQTQVGGTLPLGCSATGKAILAYLGDDAIERVADNMVAYNFRTLTSRQKLKADLAATRERGFAINRGERHLSVTGVAAPLRDESGKVEASIGISGPSERLSYETMIELGPIVKRIADSLSEELGWKDDTPLALPAAAPAAARARKPAARPAKETRKPRRTGKYAAAI